ncbi:DMT family transporter [Brevibacillus reuszeri]|uniref:DMT family transporter n=1 Tax=Brevibacillus reuszeri TaxID=54915 RepID=UPI00366CF0A6
MNKWSYYGLILLTTFMMGIAFPIGKMGLDYAPPFLLVAIRYLLAGGILAVIVYKRPKPRGSKQWLQVGTIGLFQSAGVMGCGFYSLHWITSSESAIITFVNPLIVIILGTFVLGKVYRAYQWLGVAIGFIGVVFTFGFHLNLQPGTWLAFAAAVSFAVATLLIKKWGGAFDTMVLTAYQMLAGGLIILLLSMFTEEPVFIINPASLFILLMLVVVCSILQFSVWFYLLKKGDATKTSAFLFLVPFFGVLSSWWLLGEQVQWYVIAGGALICVGIFLVNWEKKSLVPQTVSRLLTR